MEGNTSNSRCCVCFEIDYVHAPNLMNTLPCHGLWGVCECVCVCVCVRTLSLERVIVPVAHVRGFSFCSISQKSGYACQQAAMIRSWREAFSSATGDNDKGNDDNAGAGTGTGTGTDAGFMFGVTSLAGGCSDRHVVRMR